MCTHQSPRVRRGPIFHARNRFLMTILLAFNIQGSAFINAVQTKGHQCLLWIALYPFRM